MTEQFQQPHPLPEPDDYDNWEDWGQNFVASWNNSYQSFITPETDVYTDSQGRTILGPDGHSVYDFNGDKVIDANDIAFVQTSFEEQAVSTGKFMDFAITQNNYIKGASKALLPYELNAEDRSWVKALDLAVTVEEGDVQLGCTFILCLWSGSASTAGVVFGKLSRYNYDLLTETDLMEDDHAVYVNWATSTQGRQYGFTWLDAAPGPGLYGYRLYLSAWADYDLAARERQLWLREIKR